MKQPFDSLRLAAFAAWFMSCAAHADRLGVPASVSPAYQAECSSCHIAFPPGLLAAEDWKRVMATLQKHYGDNASLDEQTRRTIEDFLVANAGRSSRLSAGGGMAKAGALPRLTETAWFKRKHHEVSPADWSQPQVKSPSNCAACHTRAGQGSYREREIVMPGGRRWGD